MAGSTANPANYDLLLKALLVGDSGVGKSSILLRFTADEFDDQQLSTIGVDFKVKFIDVGGKRIKLFVWDTAGQERFRTLTSSYYRGAQGIILVYDCTVRSTFESLDFWLQEVNKHCSNTDAVKLLVSNKIDRGAPQVTKEEGERFAMEHSMLFIETSAKTRFGIQQAFEELALKILDSSSLVHSSTTLGNRQSMLFSLDLQASRFKSNAYFLHYKGCVVTVMTALAAVSPHKEKKKWDYAASAVMSGITTKTACAPFDRIRLLYQVQGMFQGSEALHAVKYRTLGHTAKTIFYEEGLVGFWRGNGANMIRAAVVYAMKFGTNDVMKERMLRKRRKQLERLTAEDRARAAQIFGVPNYKEGHIQLGTLALLKAGGVAGLVQKFVSYPLDLLSVRIALGVNTTRLNGGQKSYDSILGAFKRIYATEGWKGFYKGFAPTLLTGVPYVMLQMTFFELYKRQLQGQNKSQKDQSWWRILVASGLSGSLAGITAQAIVFPGDTIRKRMMSNGVDGNKRMYTTSIDCTKKIFMHEGLRAFYSGILPMCLRAIPSGAIQFGTYELFKSFFDTIRKNTK